MCIDSLLQQLDIALSQTPLPCVMEMGRYVYPLVVIPCLKAVICEYNLFLVYPCIKLLKVGNGGLGGGFLYCFSGFSLHLCSKQEIKSDPCHLCCCE